MKTQPQTNPRTFSVVRVDPPDVKPRTKPRAIPIIRVSVLGDRDPGFVAPEIYLDRIKNLCERENFELLPFPMEEVIELDVSGGLPLAKRSWLLQAVEMIENDEADVLVGDFYRLFRNLKTQNEVVERVEGAENRSTPGRLFGSDFGAISYLTSAQWFTATVMGANGELFRRQVSENVRDACRVLADGGVATCGSVGFGYARQRDEHGKAIRAKLLPDTTERGGLPKYLIVPRVYEMRRDGASRAAMRDFVIAQGFPISSGGIENILQNVLYLGVVTCKTKGYHESKWIITYEAHEPLVDPELWQEVQWINGNGKRGYSAAPSTMLLARLKVVRCGVCKGIMSNKTKMGGKAPHRQPGFYCDANRKLAKGTCSHPQSIFAHFCDEAVEAHCRRWIANAEGQATLDEDARAADEKFKALDAKLREMEMRAVDYGLGEKAHVKERLAEVGAERDQAKLDCQNYKSVQRRAGIKDWDDMTYEEQRALIQMLGIQVFINPGDGKRGPTCGRARITVIDKAQLLKEKAAGNTV